MPAGRESGGGGGVAEKKTDKDMDASLDGAAFSFLD